MSETKYIKIKGIHCEHCVEKIKKALLETENITFAEIKKDMAEISGEKLPDVNEIVQIITNVGYDTKPEWISSRRKDIEDRIKLQEFAVLLIAIVLVAWVLKKAFGFNIFNVIPNIDSNITYGMLVLTGMLTSIHCISMCGAINLSASTEDNSVRSIKRPVLYNLGRVLSYTFIGGLAGFVGIVFTINNVLSGCIILIAAVVMCLMALGMMGVIDFRLQSIPFFCRLFGRKSRNPFAIGLLNGLMPCGPLQAMQLYALSTGSVIMGAVSMFLFGIGTVPFMLFLGIMVNVLNGKRRAVINKTASVLILVLSVIMLNRGLLTMGIDLIPGASADYGDYLAAELHRDYQQVEFDLDYSGYQDIVVQQGIPVRMVIHVEEGYLTGCNNEVQCTAFNFAEKLAAGDNIIEFTPEEEGSFYYTCWMNMLKNTILVVNDEDYFQRMEE